jgi:formylglycine-generating enzyme required for sulfatase activity
MGSDVAADEDAMDHELPPHRVYVPECHIGKYPVTNVQYLHFVRVTGYSAPGHWEKGKMPRPIANHPVAAASWDDAVAFCAWLAQEMGQPLRLPTEAEWEKAARGVDGRIYPWGNDWDPGRCNSI